MKHAFRMGGELMGKDVAAQLVEDWDLDLDALLDNRASEERGGRVHVRMGLIGMQNYGVPVLERKLLPRKFLARRQKPSRRRLGRHRQNNGVHELGLPASVVSAHNTDGGRRLNIARTRSERPPVQLEFAR